MATVTLKLPRALPHQVPVLESAAPKKLWRAGRRTGKSVAGRIAAVDGHGPKQGDGSRKFHGMLDGANIAWVTKTYKQSKVVWRKLLRMFRDLEGTLVRIDREDRRLEMIHNGGAITVWSGHTRDALDNLRGDAYDGVLLDEGAYVDMEYALREVLQPTLIDSGGWLFVFSSPNAGWDKNEERIAPSYFNRLCSEIAEGRLTGWEQWHNKSDDNPRLNREALAALRAEYGPDSPTAQQELDASLIAGGLLAIELDKASQWRPAERAIPSHWRLFMGHDWGYRHPFATVLCGIDERNRVTVIDSTHGRKMIPASIASKTVALLDKWRVGFNRIDFTVAGGDVFHEHKSRGEQGPTVDQQYAAAGWAVSRASDGAGSRKLGLLNLNTYCKTGRLQVWDTPGNRLLWANLESRITDPDDPEDVLKQDADVNGKGGDDAYDALRYALMSFPIAGSVPEVLDADEHVDRASRKLQDLKRPNKRLEVFDRASERVTVSSGVPAERAPRLPRHGGYREVEV